MRPAKVASAAFVFAATLAGTGCASNRPPPVPNVQPAIVAGRPAEPLIATDVSALIESARAPEVLEVLTGRASYYSDALAGRPTASSEPYDPDALIAAHPDLPFGTVLRVTNVDNGRSVEVTVVDRGPFAYGRILDLSRRAAEEIDMIQAGHVAVIIEVLSYVRPTSWR